MDDFFSNLARQVLGSQPELGPLLPPRFVAWPDLSLASPLAQAPGPVDQPATAEAALFPPPLIDPEHPASDTPLPTFRQLSQVGTGPGPFIQPDAPSMPEAMPETANAEPGDIQQYVAPPLVPAADGSRPEPTMAMPPIDVGQTRQPLPAPPAQPIVQEQAGGATDVAPGQASPPADAPVTPLVPAPALEPAALPEPALEPAALPEPAPVLQQAGPAQGHQAPATSPLQPASHTQPGDESPGPTRPPADAPVTPLVPEPALEPPTAPEPAPVLQQAGPAQDHQAPATSPLQPDSHTQPGDSLPGQASPPADTPVTPLVPDPALEPPAPAGPPAAVGTSQDRPTMNSQGAPSRRAATAQGHQASSISPLQRASHSQPGDSSPGQARPAKSLPLSAEGPPAATRNQKAAVQEGRRVDAPPAHPSPRTKPPGGPGEPVVLRNGDERADSRIWPGPAEPSIVPAPEAPVVDGWPLAAARPAWSWPRPALPPPPEPLPTVRVTIGRIEVRTAPPPPAPLAPRPRPARTALSLDDYLKAGPGGEP